MCSELSQAKTNRPRLQSLLQVGMFTTMLSTYQCDLNLDLNGNKSRSFTKISAKHLASQPPNQGKTLD